MSYYSCQSQVGETHNYYLAEHTPDSTPQDHTPQEAPQESSTPLYTSVIDEKDKSALEGNYSEEESVSEGDGSESISWNEKFQSYLLMKDCSKKFSELAALAKNFSYVAETYGRIIISEQFLQNKIIEPVSIGGIAGGEKFICQNILFKFAKDVCLSSGTWIYGNRSENTEKAMKAAANELKGLSAFFQLQLPELHFPLMAIIHFRGYCLSASSVLPISKGTIIYGSADGGKTINCDENVAAIMQKAGKLLNLLEHKIGKTNVSIIGPGDIEIHKGTDDRLYVVDLGRLMPPEGASSPVGNSFFYNLLRPICVQLWDKPLSSDTFTGWDTTSEASSHQEEIVKLTKHLTTVTVREFITKVLKNFKDLEILFEERKENYWIGEDKLIKELHSSGLNCRHLGLIRRELLSSSDTTKKHKREMLAKLCLIECVTRTIKNELRIILREVMERERIGTETPYLKAVFNYLSNKISWEQQPSEMIPSGSNISISSRTITVEKPATGGTQSKEELNYCVGDFPINYRSNTFFYLEMVFKKGQNIMLGLAKKKKDFTPEYEFWSSGKTVFSGGTGNSSTKWENGDMIGLIFHSFDNSYRVQFLRNNVVDPKLSCIVQPNKPLYPIIMFDDNAVIEYNLGQSDFSFDIVEYCTNFKISPDWNTAKMSKHYWTQQVKTEIELRFPKCFTLKEHETDVRSMMDKSLFLHFLKKHCSIEFSNNFTLFSSQPQYKFRLEDLQSLNSRTSKMGIIDYAEAVNILLNYEENPSSIDINHLIQAEQQLSHILSLSNIKQYRDYYYWGSLCFALFRSMKVDTSFLPKARNIFAEINDSEKSRHKEWDEVYKRWFTNGFDEILEKIFFKQGLVLCHGTPEKAKKTIFIFLEIEFKDYSTASAKHNQNLQSKSRFRLY
eukprot:TRINITY_DN6621_c0_g1_i1.p1 TRINITY_DN6621_c0_g1~~TRINITY_DN6621_c0_g1_i1.p1  ORF type:complete len:940 (+),score=237.22 TRINITY_DN6621_c0_g1_i1:126-2822(+)